MVKVSIIMPVYNAEEFLDETFKSIINQTLKDIEVICVDDGSTDESLKVLNNLSEQYDFVKIFSTENQGSGKARNYGISKATGEYIAFLDADDSFLDKVALEKMYMFGHKEDANIVCGNLLRIKQDRSIEKGYDPKGARFSYFIQKDVLEPIEYGIPWGFYKNIYKRSFITENGIMFPDLIRGQDPIFLANILTKVDKIYVMNTNLYGYNHSVSGGVNIKLNTYDKKYAYIQHFKDTLDILIDAGFESPVHEYKKEFINYLKFQDNLDDEDLREIVPTVFGDINEYFQDDDQKFFIELLSNPEVDRDFDEFCDIKRCLFEETLISDNFINYDTLCKYVEYRKTLEDKYDEKEIKKASYQTLKPLSSNVRNEKEVLEVKNRELDKDIAKEKRVKNDVLTSNSWKATEILRNLRNRRSN